jgi:hypothetical protein
LDTPLAIWTGAAEGLETSVLLSGATSTLAF